MGPVYKIELALKSGNYEIFYGVVTDDRRGMVMSLSNVVLDNICPIILDEMSRKYSSFSDFCNFYSAPTCYTYYLAITNSTFYITNNSGNDSFCIPLNKSSVTRGNREKVLDLVEKQSNDELYRRRNTIIRSYPHIETTSGGIASFSTDLAAPLKECKVYFNPVQAGSGDPSPENVREISGWDSANLISHSYMKRLLPNTYPD